MKIAINNSNGVVVKRKIIETVEQPTQIETIEGLPFYYYFNIKIAILLIVLGIVAFFISIFCSGLFYYFIFFKNKYRCKKCGYQFSCRKSETPICPKCGEVFVNT